MLVATTTADRDSHIAKRNQARDEGFFKRGFGLSQRLRPFLIDKFAQVCLPLRAMRQGNQRARAASGAGHSIDS